MAIGYFMFSHEAGEDLVVCGDAVVGFEVSISLVDGSFKVSGGVLLLLDFLHRKNTIRFASRREHLFDKNHFGIYLVAYLFA
jgi:hypothetical protein